MKDLISVCLPTFNHARVIGDALLSVIAQSYQNLEILIVDNHSDDDTKYVVARIAAGDPRVRYVCNSENIGMARNFSTCITLARGDYIKFLCADDVLEPTCVEKMLNVMLSHPTVSLVACARTFVNDTLEPIGTARYSRRFLVTSGEAVIRRCLFYGNLIGEPTAVLFRRSDAKRGFNENYRQLMDLEMWFYILRSGAFAFLPEPLCAVRQHSEQATLENVRSGIILEDKRRLFRESFGNAPKRATFREKISWDVRMAVTACRELDAGHATPIRGVEEVFFRHFFPRVTYPVTRAIWRLLGRGH